MISDPTFGKEVGLVIEFLTWLLEKIGAAIISYGVREVLDFLRKRRWLDAQIAFINDATPKRFSRTNLGAFLRRENDDWILFGYYVHYIS